MAVHARRISETTLYGLNRRQFLGAAAAGIGVQGAGTPAIVEAVPADMASLEARLRDNIFTRLLGVRPHLAAHPNYVWTSNLRDGEEGLVVRRLREVLTQAAGYTKA